MDPTPSGSSVPKASDSKLRIVFGPKALKSESLEPRDSLKEPEALKWNQKEPLKDTIGFQNRFPFKGFRDTIGFYNGFPFEGFRGARLQGSIEGNVFASLRIPAQDFL